MTSLSRRLERLEAGCQQTKRFSDDRRRLIRQDALRHLSADQLQCLIEARRAVLEGRSLTSSELAAVKALNTATEAACQRAGLALAELKTISPPSLTRPRRYQSSRTNYEREAT